MDSQPRLTRIVLEGIENLINPLEHSLPPLIASKRLVLGKGNLGAQENLGDGSMLPQGPIAPLRY